MEILELIIRLREALESDAYDLADEYAWELEKAIRKMEDDGITEIPE